MNKEELEDNKFRHLYNSYGGEKLTEIRELEEEE